MHAGTRNAIISTDSGGAASRTFCCKHHRNAVQERNEALLHQRTGEPHTETLTTTAEGFVANTEQEATCCLPRKKQNMASPMQCRWNVIQQTKHSTNATTWRDPKPDHPVSAMFTESPPEPTDQSWRAYPSWVSRAWGGAVTANCHLELACSLVMGWQEGHKPVQLQ